ncbi:MAG: DUF6577 family protein [Bacteroidota bacterium]
MDEKHGILERFRNQQFVSIGDLRNFFSESEPGLNDATLRWRIYHLKQKDILRPVKRGMYAIDKTEKLTFDPSFSKKLDSLNSVHLKSFVDAAYGLWTTEWLAQFMELQPTNHLIIFEIEKELTYPLFQELQLAKKNVFLDPDKDIIENYILAKQNPVIVRALQSRAPLQKTSHGKYVPALEKILVDVFCDKDLFIAFQGSELKNIYRNAWKEYEINLSVLTSYAGRRRRIKPILEFIKKNITDMYQLITK